MSTGSSLRVLIADDNADAATTLALLLKHFGHDAHVVRNGEAGLQQARSLRPDVMFIDLGMAQVHGLSMARQLRQTAEFADTPLVAVSGYADPEHRAQASAAGFDDFLPKPYPMTQLLETLQRVRARVAAAERLAETSRLVAEQTRDQNQESRRRLDDYRRTRPSDADGQLPVKIEKSGISNVISLPERAAADELRGWLKDVRCRVGPVFEPAAGQFSFFVYSRRREISELVAKHPRFRLDLAKKGDISPRG